MISKYNEQKTMRAMLDFAATTAKIERLDLIELLSPMLEQPSIPKHTHGGRSHLSKDGHPLQLRLCGESPERLELTLDPYWYIASTRERLEEAQKALLGLARCSSSGAEIEASLRAITTRMTLVRGCLPEHVDGGTLLLDYVPKSKEVGFRVRLDHLDPISAWSLIKGWCQDTTPHTHKLERLIDELRASAFQIEYIGHKQDAEHGLVAIVNGTRTKRASVNQPHLAGLDASAHARLLATVNALGLYEDYREHLQLAIDPSSGRIVASRHELEPEDNVAHWIRRFEEAAPFSESALLGPQDEQDPEHTHVQRIGMEESHSQQQSHPMLTLKPEGLASPRKISRSERRAMLAERIHLAIDALLSRQTTEGHWLDYRLPFGYADCFVTAFVGLTMTRALSFEPHAQDAAQRAAGWLATKRTLDGGWGLGSHAGADTRTSALAIRLFEEIGHEIAPESHAWLLSMWDRRGGFIGSQGPRHWSDVHPCVTALAWPALDEETQEKFEPGLHEYLAKFARTDGTWHAYWWRTHHFSTYHHLYMLAEREWLEEFPIEREATHLGPDATNFEVAWALGVATLGGASDACIDTLLTELLERQQIDGSWLGSQDLRMTDPSCETPWAYPSGELYGDRSGCMTTASALWVLLDLVTQY